LHQQLPQQFLPQPAHITALKSLHPHSPEPDRPKPITEDERENLFEEPEVEDASGVEASATSASSTSPAPAETAAQIIARVRPPATPVPRADQIGKMEGLA